MPDPAPSIWDMIATQPQMQPQTAVAPSAYGIPNMQPADMGQVNVMAMLASLPHDEQIRLMRQWGMVPQATNGRITITPEMSVMLSPQPRYGDPMTMRPNSQTIDQINRAQGFAYMGQAPEGRSW